MALKLSFTINAIDNATARVKAINKTLSALSRPTRDLKNVWAASGISTQTKEITGQLRSLRTGALYITGFAVASVYALKQLSALGDEAVNTAKRIGVTVETVQQLNFAAGQNGSDSAAMTDGLKFLNRNAVEAAEGGAQASVWFRRAGISVKDAHGQMKPTDQLLGELADKFSKMPDGPRKTALAMGILGRAGSDLIPTLNIGSHGLAEMAKRARELGEVMDKETAQGLDDLGDNMGDVSSATRGILISALKPLLPMFNNLVLSLTKLLVANRALISTKITEFISGLAEVLPQVWAGIKIVANGVWWLLGLVNNIAQLFGGWKIVIISVAAYITGKLVLALAMLSVSFIKFGIVLLTTPLGWFMLAIAAIAAVAYLIIKNWEPIKAFFASLWSGIVGTFNKAIAMFGGFVERISKKFEPLKTFFSSLWGGITETFTIAVATISDILKGTLNVALFPLIEGLKLANKLMPASVKNTVAGKAVQGAVKWLDSPAQSPFGKRGAPALQEVGGTIKIQIDSDGRPKVRQVSSNTAAMNFDVDAGMRMVGG